MTDTARDLSSLLALFADNTAGDISAQDLRDFVVSVTPPDVYWTQLLSDNASSLTGWATGTGTWSVSSGTFLQSDNTANQATLMRSSGAPYKLGSLVKMEATIQWPTSGAGAGTQYAGFICTGASSGSYSNGMAQILIGRTNGGNRDLKIDDGSSNWTGTPSGTFSLDTNYALKMIIVNMTRAFVYIDGTFQGQTMFHEDNNWNRDTFGLTTRTGKVSFDDIVVSHVPLPSS